MIDWIPPFKTMIKLEVFFGFFTKCVLEVLDDRSLPGAVFPLHVVGRHKAGLVGGVSNPPPGLGVVEEPEALVLFDVQLLVLLGHVVKLGDDDHLLRHDALTALERKIKQDDVRGLYMASLKWHGVVVCLGFFFRIIITRVFKSKDNLEICNFFLSNYISSKWSLNSASEQCVHLKHTMHMCFIDSVGNVGGIIFSLLFRLGEPEVWNASSSHVLALFLPALAGICLTRPERSSERKAQRSAHTSIACRVWKQSTEYTQAIWCLDKCIQQKILYESNLLIQSWQPLNRDSVHPFKN